MSFIKLFFSYEFQFYINRIRLEKVDYVFAGIAAFFIVSALVFKIVALYKHNPVVKHFILRITRMLATVGVLGALWYGARYEAVSVFGTHFAFLVVMLVGFVWTVYILKFGFGKFRQEKQIWEKEQVKLKYLT